MAVQMWMSQMLDVIVDMGRHYLDSPGKRHSFDYVQEMCQTLLDRKGEASGTALAKEIINSYDKMKPEVKVRFLIMLTTEFAPDPEPIIQASKDYIKKQDAANLFNLNKVSEAPRLELLRLLNIAPGAMPSLVAMRLLLLNEIKKRPMLRPLETDMFHVLSSWFNRGFLSFQQIDWNTPAVILEKLIAYEAVHEIKGWRDLRRRLSEDRRCFAFFHPALLNEPLIFVEVAFTKGIAEKIQPLLELNKQNKKSPTPDTAIFYSISNCQEGLKGISFGNFLIKQVVDSITKELPQIKTFSTLSPIPKFNKWLSTDYIKRKTSIFTANEKKQLSQDNWFNDEQIRKKLRKKITHICAIYLSQEKKRKNNKPFDPVTRFHLGNGAEIENINWDADISETGLKQSAGLMVNYKYNPLKIISNHESYVNEGKIILSSKVKKLLN